MRRRCLCWLAVFSWCAAQALAHDAFAQRDNAVLPTRRKAHHKFRGGKGPEQQPQRGADDEPPRVGQPGGRRRPPNIVLLLTDDQDVELGEFVLWTSSSASDGPGPANVANGVLRLIGRCA